jgi:hypothetical protein
MTLIDKIAKMTTKVVAVNENILYSIEDVTLNTEHYGDNIVRFLMDLSDKPIETSKQLYHNILDYFKK